MRRFAMAAAAAVVLCSGLMVGGAAAASLPAVTTQIGGGNAGVSSVSCSSPGNCTAGGFFTGGSDTSEAFVASEVRGRWGQAIEVPGTAALSHAGSAEVVSVSCSSAGNCVAAGGYTKPSGPYQVFVASEVRGRWGQAIEVPGIAALGAYATVSSVSCSSAGNCTAGGEYIDASLRSQVFVVSQVGGRWGRAIEVPGTAALNAGGNASVNSVSCSSAGNCAAAGRYAVNGSGNDQAFVVSQVGGRWGQAIEVPGPGTLSSVSCSSAGNCAAAGGRSVVSQVRGKWGKAIRVPGPSTLSSVSCSSAGNCTAGGSGFLVIQVRGKWGKAIAVPGLAALGAGEVRLVSCPSAGNCGAAGEYTTGGLHFWAFVVSQVRGKWGKAIAVSGSPSLGPGESVVSSLSCSSAGNCGVAGDFGDRAFAASQVRSKWGRAIEVPGTAALGVGAAEVSSVSCSSAGNCGAAGGYADRSGNEQAFVVSEVKGTWGRAIEVPGTAALNRGGVAQVTSLSCSSAGNCGAGGYYTDGSGGDQAFVVSRVRGTWGKAIEVPGVGALNAGGLATVTSVSCSSAGNCSAAGYYTAGPSELAFVVSQVRGKWGKAIAVPGLAALDQGGGAEASSLSCSSAGNCVATGDYGSYGDLAFVVSQVNGTWGKAIEVPGIAALGGWATAAEVSCSPTGNCTASGNAGIVPDGTGDSEAFVVSRVKGTWGHAIVLPGTGALGAGGAVVSSLSCSPAGGCGAAGSYIDRSGHSQAFVVTQVKGTWGQAIEVPGTAALNQGGNAAVNSMSCSSAGNCSAAGYYTDRRGDERAFVVSQVKGTWGQAIEVPGTAALGAGGYAAVSSVSCASAGNCVAGGSYTDGTGHDRAFVVSLVKGTWGRAIEVPGTAALGPVLVGG
jgi:hypothetical protein